MKFTDFLLTLSKSPVLKAGLLSMDKLVDSIAEHHRIAPLSVEDLLSKFSQDTDRVILGFEQSECLSFIGGHILVLKETKENNVFTIRLDLYFNKKDNGVILKQLSRKAPLSLLNKESLSELNSGVEIKFEVTEPDRTMRVNL